MFKINSHLFEEIQTSDSQILMVTKYWNPEETENIIAQVEASFPDIIFGYGENRIESINGKNIPREKLHFIGNLQSKKLRDIVTTCSCVHSLESIKHTEKLEAICSELGIHIDVFLQVQLDSEKEHGITEIDIPLFLDTLKNLPHLRILGISGMGLAQFSLKEKTKEFQKLLNIRDSYLPGKLISAGTSRDYEIALNMGIDVVRIGEKIII